MSPLRKKISAEDHPFSAFAKVQGAIDVSFSKEFAYVVSG